MKEVTDNNFKEEVLESSQPVLVDFWAPGCPACETLSPVIEDLAEEFKEKAKVVKLNVAENREIPQKYEIKGVPTLIIFKNGEAAQRATGLRPKEIIADKINSLI